MIALSKRIPLVALMLLLPIGAKAQESHFSAKSIRKIDSTGWQVTGPAYIIDGKPYRVSQWLHTGLELSKNICMSLGFQNSRSADTGVFVEPLRLDFIIFNDDASVESIHENEDPNSASLLFWDSLICTR